MNGTNDTLSANISVEATPDGRVVFIGVDENLDSAVFHLTPMNARRLAYRLKTVAQELEQAAR